MKINQKKRLLVSAYAISPTLGSEYKAPWVLLKILSEYYDIVLLFGNSDGIQGGTDNFNNYIKSNSLPFEYIEVKPTGFQKIGYCLVNRFKWLQIFYSLIVKSWNKEAYKIARKIHNKNPFDIAHQLGPVGFRNPGYLWKLNCHTYWGPIGGAQYINLSMIKNKISPYFFEALFRNISVRLQNNFPYISKAAKNYDNLSFCTYENLEYFKKYYSRLGPIISDQGLTQSSNHLLKNFNDGLCVAWIGSLTPRKNVDLLIDIINASPENIIFHIFGDGPLRKKFINVENVILYGNISRENLYLKLNLMDAIISTSLSEANTASLFEAIECDCIPIVPCINGYTSTLNNNVAFFISATDYNNAIVDAINSFNILLDPERRNEILLNLRSHKNKLTWDFIAKMHQICYL
ncbi:glycosyltransferase [Polynucleobacter asymbioticus]|jgi:glycosyltransferase involved in cell wall biosynthesis|uniref:glycosyltransferase n=1 Tax=Polynucleobacter asymbioticus TaxID=576611 RepID=UPI00117D83D0|nr:glycosyltransferase [Polynucleobacter asymbioticus]